MNEGFGLGIAVQGTYRRHVSGCDQVVDANTGFLRFAGDEVGVEHFVGGPGAVTFLGVDPAICPGFDEVAVVPAFTVTPEMALTHLRLVRGQRLGADDVTLEALALELLGAAVEQHHEGVKPTRGARLASRAAASSPRRASCSTGPGARSASSRSPA